ncbi:sugar phosphate isomerase/epimerase family protein [Pseudomonas sp. DC3200b2]|uniref:sugar phosphate isomerase/epimerase family protein n=1 Tax=Pseudomonas sp. DC3200b2 TaxID=2804669 RepID=UPI003CF8E50A
MRIPVSISLSSFGAQLVRAQGQACFLPLVAQAGASHVELREELLEPGADLAAYRRQASALGLTLVYSAPLELWHLDGNRPQPQLATALAAASEAGACWLKVSLGHFTPNADFKALADQLKGSPVRLLVENDQTVQGGRIEPLVQFFAGARARQVPVGMTFDIGNWQWQGQSALGAAGQLGQYVDYLHCKAVRMNPESKLVAVPPERHDLADWARLLRRFPEGIVRAIEYPLEGADTGKVAAERVAELATLGQEVAHA